MRSSSLLAPSLAAALTVSASAYAHHPSIDFSSGGAGPITTIPAATLPAGTAAFGVRLEYARSERLSHEELLARAARDIDAHSIDKLFSPSLSFAYGLTSRFTLGFRLPYVRRAGIRSAEGERGDSAGLGDASLLGKYRLSAENAGNASALLFGVKAPTGETGKRDRQGERFETEHQPGSGSWDPLFGVALTRRIGVASFDASVLYELATEGAQDTRLGDRASYNVALSYPLGEPRPHQHHGEAHHEHGAWAAALELNGEWEGRQKTAGVTESESGGNIVYLSPGLRFTSPDEWSAYVSVGTPVVQRLRAAHSDREYRVIAGIAWVL